MNDGLHHRSAILAVSLEQIPVARRRRKFGRGRHPCRGPTANNLRNLDLRLPVGLLTCITGSPDHGKSR